VPARRSEEFLERVSRMRFSIESAALLKPAFLKVLIGTAEEAAEKVDFAASAPKGASDFK